MKPLTLAAALLGIASAAACSHDPVAPVATPQENVSAQAAPATTDFAPLIDYHVHLLGPYALPVEDPPPAVDIPTELQRLLQLRAELFGRGKTASDLASVYADGALVLDSQIDTRWMRDPTEVARFLTLFNNGAPRLVANAYQLDATVGFVSGTAVHVPSGQHYLNFLIGVTKARDGRWQIASEIFAWKKPPRYTAPITAEKLIADLDEAGVSQALVLSEAFWIGGAGPVAKRLTPARDDQTAVQLENNWTAEQVALYPDRLRMACGVKVLEPYALAELERCATELPARAMKLNIGEGGDNLDLHNQEHLQTLRTFFATANRLRMPIVIHLGSVGGLGRKEARIFMNEIVAAAPDIAVQIAHLSSGFQNPEALREFAEARAAGDPLARNLYFDLSVGSFREIPPEQAQFIAQSIRQIGLDHVLYASDEQPGDHHDRTGLHWSFMRENVPLSEQEWRVIAANVAPYMRDK